MTEMNRLRIFEEDEKFFIRRKVRNDRICRSHKLLRENEENFVQVQKNI